MAGAVPGPPDLISNMVQPVDLVNSVQRPAVETMENGHQPRAQAAAVMPVDMLGDLPSPQSQEVSPDGDIIEDRLDARGVGWFRGRQNGAPAGIPMPTTKDSDQYNMNHRRRGRAFVFNHMNFDPRLNLNVRNGTNNDRDNLRINLRQLDFDVEVHDDLPFKDIERILESASLEDHSDADCILVAVLSHGELGILYSSDQPYKPDRLWSHFTADKCPSLAGKPKMFFIQACQGDQLDHGVKMVTTESDASAGTTTYKIPSHADFLIAYSTVPGFYSWRNTTQGSWFIQAFCHVIQREAHSRDLLSILTRVSRKVAFDFQSNVPTNFGMHEKKQIPCITSMLTRDLVFTRK